MTSTFTPTATFTGTSTNTATNTATVTNTATATDTLAATFTETNTSTPTNTLIATNTATATNTTGATFTATNTNAATGTLIATSTATSTGSVTATITGTARVVPSLTPIVNVADPQISKLASSELLLPGEVVTFTIGTLSPGQTVTMSIAAQVNPSVKPPQDVTNVATLTDGRGTQRSASVTVHITSGNLPSIGEAPPADDRRWLWLAGVSLIAGAIVIARRRHHETA